MYTVNAVQDRKPAPRTGPVVTIRFRTKAEIAKIKRAAKAEGLTFNTFAAVKLSGAANETLALMTRKGTPETDVAASPAYS